MSLKDKNEYVLAIDKIKAGEILDHIKATSFPHLKDQNAKDKLYSELVTLSDFKVQKELSMKEIANQLGFGHG